MTSRRRRRAECPGPSGFLAVDKPPGWTSHDVVNAARRWLGTQQVGHLGTLDPMATGVLPLAIRTATKLAPFLQTGTKAYVGSIELGVETDTLDADGDVVRRFEGTLPDVGEVSRALRGFEGEIQQIPPMFSAVKLSGVPLHRLARKGQEVEREPKRVRIDRLEIVSYCAPIVEIEVDCSPGTYIRALADDLGRRLGCGAHLRSLRRIRSGPFELSQTAPVERMAEAATRGSLGNRLIPAVKVLGLPIVRLDGDQARRVRNGAEIGSAAPFSPGARVAAVEPSGELLAVMEFRPDFKLHPLRVLQSLAHSG